jgi:hypothetical protein
VEEIIEASAAKKFLVTWRWAKGKKASQEIEIERDFAGLEQVLLNGEQYGFVVVPIGRLLKDLAQRISESDVKG